MWSTLAHRGVPIVHEGTAFVHKSLTPSFSLFLGLSVWEAVWASPYSGCKSPQELALTLQPPKMARLIRIHGLQGSEERGTKRRAWPQRGQQRPASQGAELAHHLLFSQVKKHRSPSSYGQIPVHSGWLGCLAVDHSAIGDILTAEDGQEVCSTHADQSQTNTFKVK